MNDKELVDRLHSTTTLTSSTPLADVLSRGEQLTRRRYRVTAGAGAIVAVAALAIAVTTLSNHTAGSGDLAAGPNAASSGSVGGSSSPVTQNEIKTASFDVKRTATGSVAVTIDQWDQDPAGLQRALRKEGVQAVVRVKAQKCAYRVIPNADLTKVIKFIRYDSTPADPSDSRTAAVGPTTTTPSASASANPTYFAADSFSIDVNAIPAGTTLQLWLGNPASLTSTTLKFPSQPNYQFDLLPAGTPHC